MTQFREKADLSALAGEALEQYRLVRFSSASTRTFVYCDAGQLPLGPVQSYTASGDPALAKLLSRHPGTLWLVASGAIGVDQEVFPAADGKITATPSGVKVGTALEAATADGDIIEILPCEPQVQSEGEVVTGGAGGIAALDLVYASAEASGKLTVLKAQGTSGGNYATHLCPIAIAAAADGIAVKEFLLQGVDTSGDSVNDPVYLSDAAAGGYTTTKPTGTDKVQIVGRVVEAHATTGAILFVLPGEIQIVHTHADNSEGGQLAGLAAVASGSIAGSGDLAATAAAAAAGTGVKIPRNDHQHALHDHLHAGVAGDGGVIAHVVGLAAGYKLARGVHTTVAAADTLATGLTTVVAVVATMATDPTNDPTQVTADIGDQAGSPAAGSVYIKTWKPTAADNTALTAATTYTKKVNWIAIGT